MVATLTSKGQQRETHLAGAVRVVAIMTLSQQHIALNLEAEVEQGLTRTQETTSDWVVLAYLVQAEAVALWVLAKERKTPSVMVMAVPGVHTI